MGWSLLSGLALWKTDRPIRTASVRSLLASREVGAMAQIQVSFKFRADTKNTIRYEEEPADPKAPEVVSVGSLYVKKGAARQLGGGDFPQRLKVTIES
jgi:hypothetical protein